MVNESPFVTTLLNFSDRVFSCARMKTLSPDSDGGGGPGSQGADSPSDPPPPPVTPPSSSPAPASSSGTAPGAPAAATVIATGPVTEDTAALRAALDETNKKLKDRETEVATVKDEYHRYRESVENPRPVVVKQKKVVAFPWLRD